MLFCFSCTDKISTPMVCHSCHVMIITKWKKNIQWSNDIKYDLLICFLVIWWFTFISDLSHFHWWLIRFQLERQETFWCWLQFSESLRCRRPGDRSCIFVLCSIDDIIHIYVSFSQSLFTKLLICQECIYCQPSSLRPLPLYNHNASHSYRGDLILNVRPNDQMSHYHQKPNTLWIDLSLLWKLPKQDQRQT